MSLNIRNAETAKSTGLTMPLQPRRLIIAPAADGCKRSWAAIATWLNLRGHALQGCWDGV